MTQTFEIPVLIVGGGPTGLCASIALSHFGIPSLLVEKHASISPFPRTRAVHRRSMEIFRHWGLEERIHVRELDLEPVIAWAPSVTAPIVRTADYVQHSNPDLSPCEMSPIFQHELEQLLLANLEVQAVSELRFSTELQSFHVDETGVRAVIRDRKSGEENAVIARYMIAADGANSMIRKALGIPMRGPGDLAENVLIRFEADLSRWTGSRPPYFYFLLGARIRAVYLTGRDHVWVLNAEDPALAGSPVDAVRAAIGGDVPFEILDEPGSWTTGAQVADTFSVGPVFLAGDAAHRLTPAGGMGMNTGIQDVHDLAWKLAAVTEGWAGEGLLGTYQAERRPVAVRNVDWSLGNWGCFSSGKPFPPAGAPNTEEIDLGAVYQSAAVVSDGTPLPEPGIEHIPSARPGSRAPHLSIGTREGVASTVDLFDREFVLLTGVHGSEWIAPFALSAEALDVPFQNVVITEPEWRTAYGVAGDGAVLVRPDGHVAWRCSTRPGADPHDVQAMFSQLVCRSSSPPVTAALPRIR